MEQGLELVVVEAAVAEEAVVAEEEARVVPK
jgi:hypothetical protein